MIYFTTLQLIMQAPHAMSKISDNVADVFGKVHGYARNLLEQRRLVSEVDIDVVLRSWGLYGHIVRIDHDGKLNPAMIGKLPSDRRRRPHVVIYSTGPHFFPVCKFEKPLIYKSQTFDSLNT